MAEIDPFAGMSEEDRRAILYVQYVDDETEEERKKREEFQRTAELLNEEYLASQGVKVEEKKWDVSEDAAIARAMQENWMRPTIETDAELARNFDYMQLLEDAYSTTLRTTEEEKYTSAVLHNSPVGIPLWNGMLLYTCPHCGGRIATLQNEIACTIFTHGATSAGQVNQHLSDSQAAAIAASGVVKAGCMKQYKLVVNGDRYDAVGCSGL